MPEIASNTHSSNTFNFHRSTIKRKIYLKQSVPFHLSSTLLHTEKVPWSQITFQRTEHFLGTCCSWSKWQLNQCTFQVTWASYWLNAAKSRQYLSAVLTKRALCRQSRFLTSVRSPFANAIVSTDNKPDIQVSAHSRMWHFMNFHQAPWRINSSIVSLVSCPNFIRNLVSFSLFDHNLVPDRPCKKTLLWVSHLDNYQNEKANTINF